jgi:hypothetical protein
MNDPTLNRLHELTVELKGRLREAEAIRVRLTKAREQNIWPDLRCLSRLFTDIQNRTN